MCLKKVRVTKDRRNIELEQLFNERRSLRNKKDENSVDKLKVVETKLADIYTNDNAAIIKEACEGLTCEGGGVNASKLWNLKRKLQGTLYEPPTAMHDEKRNIVTTSEALHTLTIIMYKKRLQPNTMRENMKLHETQQEQL